MSFDLQTHQRRSIRLPGHDYSQAGGYFVTICTQHRECLFGKIADGVMQLNQAGQMIQSIWVELPQRYLGVSVDAFIVMPNHIHGIILLTNPPVGAGHCACPINQSKLLQPINT